MKSNAWWRIAVVAALLVAIVAVVQIKRSGTIVSAPSNGRVATQEQPLRASEIPPLGMDRPGQAETTPPSDKSATTLSQPAPAKAAAAQPPDERGTTTPTQATRAKPPKGATPPRLVEVGAETCIPCKMMQPILAELRQEFTGKLQVDFVDVWKNPAEGDKYRVQIIPTQVFFDRKGKEVFRHVGFFPKEQIIAKFKELGIDL